MEDLAYMLGTAAGDFDTYVCLICREGCAESFLLTWAELACVRAQEKLYLIEGIACTSAAFQCFLLDTAAHLSWCVAGELDNMKGIQHAGSVLELAIIRFLTVSGRGLMIRPRYRSGPTRRARPASSCTWCYTCLKSGLTSGLRNAPPLA